MNQKKIIDHWVIIGSFFILMLIAINIPFTTTESHAEKEFYTEQVPYTTTETYFEKEAYIENVPLNINATLKWYISDHRVNDQFDLIATLKNIDNVTGEFWVKFHVESTNGSFDFTSNRTGLKPGESYQINQRIDGALSYVTYRINQPTQEIKKFRDIPKERTVTGYHAVENSRDVIRIKKNKLSLLQRILNNPPNYEPEPSLPQQVESTGDEMGN
jgi:hypothetical protein